jgi:hypothetical protein
MNYIWSVQGRSATLSRISNPDKKSHYGANLKEKKTFLGGCSVGNVA